MMTKTVVIVGAGPAGLIAAEVLATAGVSVHVYDAMPSAGRKFLQAGRGGLNITHSAGFDAFVRVYADAQSWLSPLLAEFGSKALQDWVHGFGIETFIGSSGRVFPRDKKAAPLLRAWIHRLKMLGVQFEMKHRLITCSPDRYLTFITPNGQKTIHADAVILALGGGSWSQLGSDGQWVAMLESMGVDVAPLKPSNCGFDVGWSDFLATKFAGQPLKSVVLSFIDNQNKHYAQKGELMLTQAGLEGGLIYHFSALLRDKIATQGSCSITLDLLPDWSESRILAVLSQPRGRKTLTNLLRSQLGLSAQAIALLHEAIAKEELSHPKSLAKCIKSLPIKLTATGPINEAISTAGGVTQSSLAPSLMLNQCAGVFCAGEMLDWEAPTGGYLLTAVFSTGVWVGNHVMAWLTDEDKRNSTRLSSF